MADILSIEREKLYQIYAEWPLHFEHANNARCRLEHEREYYQSVLLCGMGGSATACDILNDILHSYGNIHSLVIRGHIVPSYTNKNTLLIVNTASGNTEEAILTMEEASSRGAEVICISSGGKLREMAHKYGHKHVNIKSVNYPRAALPYLLMPGLKLISAFLPESAVKEFSLIPKSLLSTYKKISADAPFDSNPAKKIAAFLSAGLGFCFTSPYLFSVGTRFKNSLNENSKMFIIRESVLEASHNEIVPLVYYSATVINAKVMLLRWRGDTHVIRNRFAKMGSLFTSINCPLLEVNAFDNSLINAILSMIYILDYSTLYMAEARKINPSITPAIDILKKA